MPVNAVRKEGNCFQRRTPYCRPTVEEELQSALRNGMKKLSRKRPELESYRAAALPWNRSAKRSRSPRLVPEVYPYSSPQWMQVTGQLSIAS